MRKYARLLRYALPRWKSLVLTLILSAAVAGGSALQPWPVKILVDYALGGRPLAPALRPLANLLGAGSAPLTLIIVAAISSLVLVALTTLLDTAVTWCWTVAGQRMIYDLAADLFAQLQRLSLLFHGRRGVGDALSRITGDTWSVYTLTNGLLVSPVHHALTLAAVTVAAWQLDRRLALLTLVVAPLLAASAFWFGRRLRQHQHRNREALTRLMSFVQQTLTAIPLVQAFDAADRNTYTFRTFAERAVRASRSNALIKQSFALNNGLTTTLGMAMVLYAGGTQVLAGHLSLGSLLVFVAYLRTMQGSTQKLLSTYADLRVAEANVDRVLEVLDAEERVRESPQARALSPGSVRGEVRLESVSFGYEPGHTVLHEVSFEVQPGETLALVGPTGAGKSTLAALIPRFFDPCSGRVLLDGQDLRELTLASLRAQIALVLQEPFLLPLTVAENIAYGRPGAERDEIVAAAAAANAEEFIRRLPAGYDTVLGERGVNLSGGQKQRVAIARALLKDAPVLVMDEPTSALDAGTEARVLEALERLMHGRTTVLIAHRLSTIRRADRIVVLEAGRVVETGNHRELLSAPGAYQRLYALQFAAHPEEGAA